MKEFIKERFSKLIILFIGGILILVPIQTLYARKFFFVYNGNIFNNYKYFFMHFTDLSGNDGCFTPGHLWFILFLFIISLFALLIIKYIPYKKVSIKLEKVNIIAIILLFIPIWLMSYIGAFGVYSFGRYFTLYLLGYYMITNEIIMDKITNYFKKRSFPIYILHLPVLIIIGYYSLIMTNNISLQICMIIFGSFIVTILLYEIIKKISILKRIIGVR